MSAASAGTRPAIAVVHLVWGPLGTLPLRRFLASYRSYPAGADHELIVLLNGVEDRQREELLAELDGIDHRTLEVPGPVQDLAAYKFAANALQHERLCFLNSHSEVLAEGWLAHFDGALARSEVGLVGASGSWASWFSYGLYQLGLPSAYREVFDDRRSTLMAFERLQLERTGEAEPRHDLMRTVHTMLAIAPLLLGFRRFPAPHVRTNAFALDRALLTRVARWNPRRKMNAYRVESGRSSLTAQIERAGLRAVVVDRFGDLFQAPAWPASETFWQGSQAGLLVADNQTEAYARAGMERRMLLARLAWGALAAPADPAEAGA